MTGKKREKRFGSVPFGVGTASKKAPKAKRQKLNDLSRVRTCASFDTGFLRLRDPFKSRPLTTRSIKSSDGRPLHYTCNIYVPYYMFECYNSWFFIFF